MVDLIPVHSVKLRQLMVVSLHYGANNIEGEEFVITKSNPLLGSVFCFAVAVESV